MVKDKKDDFLEPEIIENGFKKIEKEMEGFEENTEKVFKKMEGGVKSVRRTILLKGLTALIFPILAFLLIMSGIVALIMLLFDHPFDYIFSAIFIFLVLRPIYKLIKMFK